jgi:3-deoxy-7-phosphoheptulonate synthase
MIIQLEKNITDSQLADLIGEVESLEYKVREVRTQYSNYIVGVGKASFDLRHVGHRAGVRDIHRVSDAYKLVSRKWKAESSPIAIDAEMSIGTGDLAIMAGPCSIEGEEQIESTVAHLVENGVKLMRGGVYKPRSSPYSFRGLGIDGLKVWNKACRDAGIRIITEVMHTEQIADMVDYIDIFQVGARNSQNFNLLDALGEVDKPVMIKRGMSGTLEELLQSAEYVFAKGNERILLCERGIRTYETAYRNTLDLNAIPILKEKTHLPVIVDPSHGIGLRRYVESMALAGIMAGADGVIVEVHECPEKAFSDGQQTLSYAEASAMYGKMRKVHALREEIM